MVQTLCLINELRHFQILPVPPDDRTFCNANTAPARVLHNEHSANIGDRRSSSTR